MLYRIQIAVAAVHSSAKGGTHLKCNDRDFSSPLTLLLPRRRLPRRCGRPFASLRPSVFLSETSTLILVVEIGFLRHRSRGTDGRTEKTDDDFDDEGGKKRRGGKETRSPDGRTDGRGLAFYPEEGSALPSFLPRHAYTKQAKFYASQIVRYAGAKTLGTALRGHSDVHYR